MYTKLQDTHSRVETEFARRNVIGSTPHASSPLRPLRVCLSPNRWKREPLKIKVDPGLRDFLHFVCLLASTTPTSNKTKICLTLPLKTSETTQVMIEPGYGRPLRTRIQLLTDSSFNYVIDRPSSVVGGNVRFGCCQRLKLCAPASSPLLTTFLLLPVSSLQSCPRPFLPSTNSGPRTSQIVFLL